MKINSFGSTANIHQQKSSFKAISYNGLIRQMRDRVVSKANVLNMFQNTNPKDIGTALNTMNERSITPEQIRTFELNLNILAVLNAKKELEKLGAKFGEKALANLTGSTKQILDTLKGVASKAELLKDVNTKNELVFLKTALHVEKGANLTPAGPTFSPPAEPTWSTTRYNLIDVRGENSFYNRLKANGFKDNILPKERGIALDTSDKTSETRSVVDVSHLPSQKGQWQTPPFFHIPLSRQGNPLDLMAEYQATEEAKLLSSLS